MLNDVIGWCLIMSFIGVPSDKPVDMRYAVRVILAAVFALLLALSLFGLNGSERLYVSLGIFVTMVALIISVDTFIKRRTPLSPSETENY
jgi:hypothetical protein